MENNSRPVWPRLASPRPASWPRLADPRSCPRHLLALFKPAPGSSGRTLVSAVSLRLGSQSALAGVSCVPATAQPRPFAAVLLQLYTKRPQLAYNGAQRGTLSSNPNPSPNTKITLTLALALALALTLVGAQRGTPAAARAELWRYALAEAVGTEGALAARAFAKVTTLLSLSLTPTPSPTLTLTCPL